jgi:hypothetical protein
MEAFLNWRGFDVPCASEIPNAGIVLGGMDWWQVGGAMEVCDGGGG